ncbi:MAG: hypothetical protein GX621_04955, partial [Pirellulaceae bacterium]|nr:hypothetical protein [Pirellulaceae bacterium]
MKYFTMYGVLFVLLGLTGYLDDAVALADLAVTQTGREGIVSLDGQKLLEWTLPKVDERIEPEVEVVKAADGWYRVRATWTLAEPVKQDELSASFAYRFSPDFWWSPHLTPRPGDAIAQHVFRSPAIIAAEDRKTVVIVPDLDLCGQEASTPWFMDYDAPARQAWLGMSKTDIWVQLGYEKIPGMVLPEGKVQLGFYVTAYEDDSPVANPWAKVSRFLWETWGRPLFAKGEPLRVPLDRFVEHTYRWAFDTWSKHVWQEFDIDGRRVGAPAFIVNISQSPNYKRPYYQREDLSIWNQAWFSSLRSA